MKTKVFLISILLFFIHMQLFAEDDMPTNVWNIDDYKETILVKSSSMLIHEFFELFSFETGEKYFISKWNSEIAESRRGIRRFVSLYFFNKYHEFKEYPIALLDVTGLTKNAIEIVMHTIPGHHLWDNVVSIGDFNNDGIDEIASFFFGGSEPVFQIIGIDSYSKEVVIYLYEGFSVDFPPTYTPVEYVSYKGRQGFRIVKFIDPTRAEIKHPIPERRNLAWIFYTWDEGKREYIEVEEVDPRYLGEERAELNRNKIEQVVGSELSTEHEPEKPTKDSQFPLWLFIGGGLVLLAAVGVVIKRKKLGGE